MATDCEERERENGDGKTLERREYSIDIFKKISKSISENEIHSKNAGGRGQFHYSGWVSSAMIAISPAAEFHLRHHTRADSISLYRL
jgi:hypothetical protein